MVSQKTLVTKVVGLGTCKKWGQDSKVCYGTCPNHGQLGTKPSEVLLGVIFCEDFFSETLVCQVWYFS
jgi:hypothetical protein